MTAQPVKEVTGNYYIKIKVHVLVRMEKNGWKCLIFSTKNKPN